MISIIIPVYNKYNRLDACLASVAQQTFQDIETIVVDDGSDNPQTLDDLAKKYTVDHVIHQNNQGAPTARNNGFDVSQGEYVIFVDADMVLEPDMLTTLYQALQANPEAAFAYSQFKHGWKKFHTQPFDAAALRQQNYIHTSALIRREVFPRFDETLKKFQDWDLWLTIVEQGGVGVFVPEVLFCIVDTHGTMSTWLPSFVYTIPWPIFGYTPKAIEQYFQAKKVIYTKHNLV